MEQLTVTLPNEVAKQLKTAARKVGVEPEEFLLARLDDEFVHAMKYVLKKNAELYKRLV